MNLEFFVDQISVFCCLISHVLHSVSCEDRRESGEIYRDACLEMIRPGLALIRRKLFAMWTVLYIQTLYGVQSQFRDNSRSE
jgi:hypothetical protein